MNEARVLTRVSIRKIEGEWVCCAYDQHGKRWKEADYFALDKADATETAVLMVRHKRSFGNSQPFQSEPEQN